jgi:hypothetical protein
LNSLDHPVNDIIDICIIPLRGSFSVKRNRKVLADESGKLVYSKIRPLPGSVYRKEPQAGCMDSIQMTVGVAEQLSRFFVAA